MYWDDCASVLVFEPVYNNDPIAKKDHICCECGETIKKGEKYSCCGGLWCEDNGFHHIYKWDWFKTCVKCERAWKEILEVFEQNGEDKATRVYGEGKLQEAIRDAYDLGYLTDGDKLVNEWLDIWPEIDYENLSLYEKDIEDRKTAFFQMVVNGAAQLSIAG